TCTCRPPTSFSCGNSASTEIYTLSLHDALPIYEVQHIQFFQADYLRSYSRRRGRRPLARPMHGEDLLPNEGGPEGSAAIGLDGSDRKSTRLNSSHVKISYAVFCLKKKNTQEGEN